MRKLLELTGIAAVITLFLYVGCFLWVDRPVAYWLHEVSASSIAYHAARWLMVIMSMDVWSVIAGLGLILCAIACYLKPNLWWQRGLMFSLSMLVALFIGGIIKIVLARYRPELLFTQGLYGFHFFSTQPLFNSTPSGHTLRSFVLATCVTLFWRRYGGLLIIFAILVGLSRLVLEVHYVSDVLLGAFIGVFVPLWIHQLFFSKTST